MKARQHAKALDPVLTPCPRCGLEAQSTIAAEELARGAYEKCSDCGYRLTPVPLIRCTQKPPCGHCFYCQAHAREHVKGSR